MTPPPAERASIVLITDTREQLPLVLPNSQIATLRTGDYSVEGFEDRIAVERKSLADLFGCFGQSRERFERELERLAAYPYPALVIEAHMGDLLNGTRYSRVHPNAAIGSLIAWSVKHRIPVWLAGDRNTAALVVERILRHAVKYLVEKECVSNG